MNLLQDVLRNNQSADAPGSAFVPTNRPVAEVHRTDAGVPETRHPSLDRADYRRGTEAAGRVEVPVEELRLLASHCGAGRRLSSQHTWRLRVGLLVAGLVAVAALLGWQHRGDEVKQMASSSMASLWPASPIDSSRVAIVEGEATSASPVDAAKAVASEQAPAPTAPPDRATGPAGELQQQMQSIARELGIMKQNLEQLAAKQEQLAAKQEQMARDIAALRTVKQDDKLTTASGHPQRSVALPPRKKPLDLPPPLGPRPLTPAPASARPQQQDVIVRPPPQQDVVTRPPQQQDVVIRPPMPLRQD
jgi:hypothetical protein